MHMPSTVTHRREGMLTRGRTPRGSTVGSAAATWPREHRVTSLAPAACYRWMAGTQAVVRPPMVSWRIFSPAAVTAPASRPQRR